MPSQTTAHLEEEEELFPQEGLILPWHPSAHLEEEVPGFTCVCSELLLVVFVATWKLLYCIVVAKEGSHPFVVPVDATW